MSTPLARTMLTRALSVAIAVAVAASAFACSVPVFRYAIEHWRPDAYRVFVYHDQDLGEADRALLSKIKAETQKGANVQVQTIDLRGSTEPIDKARWDLHSDKPLPQMVVQLPSAIGGGEAPVAVADWNDTEVANLLSSPKRNEIAQRLVDGEVVWVFLESDDQESSDKLFQVLHEQLAIQQETLELPEIDDADLKDLSADPESLEIRFSTIRVSRGDAAEKWFVDMLLSIEPDLRDAELVDQAMVFPVFGRGRALYALVGDGINADMIRDAATFLTGACQCTVKAENPGVDLLIPMPWDQLIKVSEPLEVSLPLVGLGGGLPMAGAQGETRPTPDDTIAITPIDHSVAKTAEADGQSESAGALGQSDQAALSNVAELASLEQQSAGLGLWLPILLVLAIGSVAGLMGAFVLRR